MELDIIDLIEIITEINNELFSFHPDYSEYWYGICLRTDGDIYYVEFLDFTIFDGDNFSVDCPLGMEKLLLKKYLIDEIGKILHDLKKINIVEIDDGNESSSL